MQVGTAGRDSLSIAVEVGRGKHPIAEAPRAGVGAVFVPPAW